MGEGLGGLVFKLVVQTELDFFKGRAAFAFLGLGLDVLTLGFSGTFDKFVINNLAVLVTDKKLTGVIDGDKGLTGNILKIVIEAEFGLGTALVLSTFGAFEEDRGLLDGLVALLAGTGGALVLLSALIDGAT